MYKRIKNTSADMEANQYEASGMGASAAWDLVLREFHKRTNSFTASEKEILRIAHFETIGQSF